MFLSVIVDIYKRIITFLFILMDFPFYPFYRRTMIYRKNVLHSCYIIISYVILILYMTIIDKKRKSENESMTFLN